MTKNEMIERMNLAGKKGEEFIFIIDFEMKNCRFHLLSEIGDGLFYSINEKQFVPVNSPITADFYFEKHPVNIETYKNAFDIVFDRIQKGYTYLANLTFPTKLHTNLGLEEIFSRSNAQYKLLLRNEFVSFSPECFVKIKDGIIRSFPMKGTIDASLPEAESLILSDTKETAEHFIIVDLIRNDLSQVATEVEVETFRYLDRIETNDKTLLQVSSSIKGKLAANFKEHLDNIIFALLPAGSVTGAPKISTLDIIRSAEIDARGYYTGVWGIFDGNNLDSAVLIRFIESTNDGLIFRSGGGITANSKCDREYNELFDKVYVPFT